MVLYVNVRYCMVTCNVWYCMVLYAIWYVVLNGFVWYTVYGIAMVRYGMVWHGML